jgi:hypothetical protein
MRNFGGTTPVWQPSPDESDWQRDVLVDETGREIACLEDFGCAAYPIALSAATGKWQCGGPYQDRVAAMQWAERIAGVHPAKPGDARSRESLPR